jgi:peptidoglycan-associated lipoprotein
MWRARPLAILAALTSASAIACGPKPVRTAPARAAEALVVLLPDSDTGTTGRLVVSNPAGSVDLAVERQSTTVTTHRHPGTVTTLTQAQVTQVFGAALSALPPAPRHFTLFYQFESDELTDGSRALVSDILNAVKERSVPEVVVVGHTDTMGSARANVDLGLKRASMVRDLLVRAGLDPALIEVTSHGERDPLIATADETAEPRNRRVEISVR